MGKFKFFRVAKISGFLVIVFLALSFLSGNSFACYDEPDCIIEGTTDLIAGQYTDVGDLNVYEEDGFLYVEYKTDSGWLMSETHLHVATNLDDIPQANGNPIPGQFEFKREYSPKTDFDVYKISLSNFDSGTLYIAAHAVVCKNELASLPSGSASAEFWESTTSTFETHVISSLLNGIFPSFCVNINRGNFVSDVDGNYPYEGTIRSSYDPYFESSGPFPFDHPENLDLVNYVINKYYQVESPNNIQAAIWTLLENKPTDPTTPPYVSSFEELFDRKFGSGNWNSLIVGNIVNDAINNGEGYIPSSGDWVGFILFDTYSDQFLQDLADQIGITMEELLLNFSDEELKLLVRGQAVIIIMRVPKTCCETAWGEGCDFPGKDWAMYFMYNLTTKEGSFNEPSCELGCDWDKLFDYWKTKYNWCDKHGWENNCGCGNNNHGGNNYGNNNYGGKNNNYGGNNYGNNYGGKNNNYGGNNYGNNYGGNNYGYNYGYGYGNDKGDHGTGGKNGRGRK